jgi:hypothetical protein
VSRIELPAPIFYAWLVLTLVLMGQGIRLARQNQEDVEPHRPVVLAEGGQIELPEAFGPVLYEGSRPGRLALYEVLPERRLLRWVEDPGAESGPLLIPLEGLGAGDYVLADAPGETGAAGQEMDRPDRTLPARARFTVLPD